MRTISSLIIGGGLIPAGSTLLFDAELLSADGAGNSPTPAQPPAKI